MGSSNVSEVRKRRRTQIKQYRRSRSETAEEDFYSHLCFSALELGPHREDAQ